MIDEDKFLDQLYSVPTNLDLWLPVMEQFADMVGGGGGWLSQLDVVDGTGCRLEDPITRSDPMWAQRYIDHYAACNPVHHVADPQSYLRDWVPCVLTDEDWMPKEALVKTEYYNDFLTRLDVDSSLMLRLARNGSEIAVLNIGRPKRRGQFQQAEIERARRLHPHFIRAYNLSQRLASLHRANREMAQALDMSVHGIFVADETGQIRHSNGRGEALLRAGSGLTLAQGRLSAATAAQTRQLQAMIAAATVAPPETRLGGSMALASPRSRHPLSVAVVPLGADRFEIFHGGRGAMICVTDLEAPVLLPEEQLRQLFGLTPAESRLALALLDGDSQNEAAVRFGTSPNTVRAQLSRIFEKTGTRRQSDLVRLLMRLTGVASF